MTIWNDYKKKRIAQKEEARLLLIRFQEFAIETEPLAPYAEKHPKASLYRHCWKRAVVLEDIHQQLENNSIAEQYKKFQNMAVKKYYEVAPETLYGQAKLQLSGQAQQKLFRKEISRFTPDSEKSCSRDVSLACIYVGFDNLLNHPYVGQTTREPEARWVQHRTHGTGPFKDGASYAEWKILAESVVSTELDGKEAFFIGLYDAYDGGHNDTKGNDIKAYLKGQSESYTKQEAV